MVRALIVALALLWAAPALAQPGGTEKFALLITNPDEAILHANSAYFRAHPNIVYERPLSAIGGCRPFSWSFVGGSNPAWLSIVEVSGSINSFVLRGTPTDTTTDDATDITIQVTDSCATPNTDTATLDIDVTTTGFLFIDDVNGSAAASNGGSATGAIGSKFATFNDVYENSSATSIIYVRNANGSSVYLKGDMPSTSSCTGGAGNDSQIFWRDSARGTQFIGYPGDARPVYDHAYDGSHDCSPRAEKWNFETANGWVQGLEFRNAHIKSLQFEQNPGAEKGQIIYDNYFDGLGDAPSSSNCAFIGMEHSTPHRVNTLIALNTFTDWGNNCSITKHYDEDDLLLAENLAFGNTREVDDGGFALKDATERTEFFGNYCDDVIGPCIAGNFQDANNIEFRYNNALTTNGADLLGDFSGLHVNQNANATNIYVHHNTIRGVAWIRGATTSANIIEWTFNIIENSLSTEEPETFFCIGLNSCNGVVGDLSVIAISDNQKDTVGDLVDSDGIPLNPAHVGVYGHTLDDEPAAPADPVRLPIRGLRFGWLLPEVPALTVAWAR